MFLKQKAKVQWLKEGDKCTKFFHSIISGNNKRDTIRILINDQGRRLESFDEMAAKVTKFYSGLLGTADPGVKNCDPNLLKDLMQFNLPPDYSSNLVKEVSGEEKSNKSFSTKEMKKLQVLMDSLHTFSKKCGCKEIRQGDPLSPILFVLTMNVLSRILNLVVARGLFGYHPKCKMIGLTHLSFTDDLLIFCKGNIEFVAGIISALDQFYELSGLKLNAAKCELSTAGISFRNLEHILQSTGFTHGCLPVRYLGVPLVTRKLTEKDCVVLIENIKLKLHHWSGKHLIYGLKGQLGRVGVDFRVQNKVFLGLSIDIGDTTFIRSTSVRSKGINSVMDEEAVESFQAQAHLYKHIFNYISSMSLKCAVQLGIPDAIHSHRQPITLSELVSALGIDLTKASFTYQLMLVHSGFFAKTTRVEKDQEHEAYVLTPFSKILIKENINWGGTGTIARVISEAHPQLKCTVFDLPHVLANLPATETGNLNFVAGDMFQYLPPADAILMELVLHAFSDEDCMKTRKRCREGIPGEDKKGKVIIIDIVINVEKDEDEAKLFFDVLMMVVVTGRERIEQERKHCSWQQASLTTKWLRFIPSVLM
ncbi:Trans-resveratrol di-O-methyltransferase [Hibiscus syriacus]|uniref:Trans-resveratrol di-O-methyltransferase n=1 Tax=Hibiscus syriacus TaxID=106335 RepID=A0A6A3CJV4_HIBSY|nr:Trans-resveratrol di-O-methyltransferase [Hibiscus syriacus]